MWSPPPPRCSDECSEIARAQRAQNAVSLQPALSPSTPGEMNHANAMSTLCILFAFEKFEADASGVCRALLITHNHAVDA
jgi:hypothetical protein